MDPLNTRTTGTTEKEAPNGCFYGLLHELVELARAFARKVRRIKELIRPRIPQSEEVHTDFRCNGEHDVSIVDVTSKITETDQPVEPPYNRPTSDKAETVSYNLPAIDKSLIKSSEAVKTVLLQSYPNSPDSQSIARPVHGLQHSCRTATWALSILQLRKQQLDPLALAFPDHMVPLLIKACLFHDSGREGDGLDQPEWEQASADNLSEHLRNCGVEQSLAWQCGEAIYNKDNPNACRHLPEAIQTLRSLLHDADTLDVMRVRDCFFMNKLECFNDCHGEDHRQNWRVLATEVCKVIAGQGDLWSSIELCDGLSADPFFSIDTASRCKNTKKQWEHHPSPLWHQLSGIGKQSPYIQQLISPATEHLAEPPELSFSMAKLDTLTNGLYNDPVTQQCYSIKQASCELSARNQALMGNLARLLGITVPESFVHQEQGQFYVVSHVPGEWSGNLKGGEEALQSLSSEQWARLMLVNVIVGNESMVNSAWEGIELTPQGEPVMRHWDHAGLATRYLPRDEAQSVPGTDDFSSMPVLLKKLRDPRAPVMNSFPVENPCVDILAQLDDDFLGQTLQKILGQVDWQALDQLIEQSGFLAGDRSWLRQTIHDRIAWLTTRLPHSHEGDERVSMAQYKAIESAGIRGGWLPVKGKDVDGGQICMTQLLDANGEPITQMSLRLSQSAGNQLADNLALERGLIDLAHKVTNINLLKADALDWRSDLACMASECNDMADQLAHDIDRWHPDDQGTIGQTERTLREIVITCKMSLLAERPLIKLPKIETPLPTPLFPARVSSRMGEEAEDMIQKSKFSHGFAKLTGQSIPHIDRQRFDGANKLTPLVNRVELKPSAGEEGSILFYPPNLSGALTYERKLTITLPGHGKAVVEGLFRELAELGIDGARPNADDLEAQWLDSLADYHGCLGDMNSAVATDVNSPLNSRKKEFLKQQLQLSDDALLDWEVHCRIRAGRLVHYRPGFPHDISPARNFFPGHNVNFMADQQQDAAQVVIDSLANEGALGSYGRRTDIGLDYCANAENLPIRINSNTNYVFSRIQSAQTNDVGDESRREYAGDMNMMFKSETLGRLDGMNFAKVAICPEVDVLARNQKIITKSTDDYRRLAIGSAKQETLFAKPLSLFDELEKIQVTSLEDQYRLLHMLKQRYSHWPDGRPLEQLFPQSWAAYYFELTCANSKVNKNIKDLIKLCGRDGIQLLFEQNPQLLEGRLVSLDGLKLEGKNYTLRGFDLSNCSMNGTVIKSVSFKSCKINAERLSCATVDHLFFSKCSFEGERFSLSILENVHFLTGDELKKFRVLESTQQLSRIIYQSCVNQKNELNLDQWLEVMLKNYFLRSTTTPLDELSQNTLSQHIERIIDGYPDRICRIINGSIGIQFESVEHAISFVRNNPQFHGRKVKDFRDWYFDYRDFLSGKYKDDKIEQWWVLEKIFSRLRSGVSKGFSPEAVLELMFNVANLAAFRELEREYIEFNDNFDNTDDHNHVRNNIPEKESVGAKINTMPCTEPDDIIFGKIVGNVGSISNFKVYQQYFYELWEACSDESKLTIAKFCLSHRVILVSKSTKEKFLKFLAEKPGAEELTG